MAKDYFKESKAITSTILDSMARNNEFDESQYYTIDILDVEDTHAKVMIDNKYRYLTKESGTWSMDPEVEAAVQNA